MKTLMIVQDIGNFLTKSISRISKKIFVPDILGSMTQKIHILIN